MSSLFSSPKTPDNSASIKAQNEALQLQKDQAASAKDQQSTLDAQIASRRRAKSAAGGGRSSLLTGTELGVQKSTTLG